MTENELLFIRYLIFYLIGINFAAGIAAVTDKLRARAGAWRISEKRLLLFGALGGALGEWVTMLIIRHKTKSRKFMILLPLFTIVHVILVVWMLLS